MQRSGASRGLPGPGRHSTWAWAGGDRVIWKQTSSFGGVTLTQVDKRTWPPVETVGFSGPSQLGVGRISLTSQQDRILGLGGNGSELATSSDAEQGGVVPRAREGRTLQQSKCSVSFQWRQTSAFKVVIWCVLFNLCPAFQLFLEK